MGKLTDADKQILPLALRQNGGFHIATQWYCKGWEPLPYQYAYHHAKQQNVTFIAGIAAGKSTATAGSYLIDCLTTPHFRALNTSVTSKQAEIPFEMVSSWIDDNARLQHLIDNINLRPYPTIEFTNGSVWVFRTVGKDARFIRGLEFDRINYDEAGLDFVGEAVKVLRGRLRGVRPDNTQRMARMDVITSPTDAPWLKERFDKGWKGEQDYDPKHFLSLRVSTYMNTRLDPEQIKLMEAEYSDDMIRVELGGEFPDYGASMFAKVHVHACTDISLNDAADEALHPENGKVKPGYRVDEHPRYGITLFELPYVPGHRYIMAGDPGTEGPPKRNAGVVMVADITTKPARIAYFHWVDGRSSYAPFLMSYKYALEKYHPLLKGLDVTGTQKAIDELAFENYGISIDGLAFNRDKEAMLNCLISVVSGHEIVWPAIKGIIRQMSSYSRAEDDKIPQDITMTMAEIAFLMRYAPEDETDFSRAEPMRRLPPARSSYSRRRR